MTPTVPLEIGLLHYPGAQVAALLGLADLFETANRQHARLMPDVERAPLRISHWQARANGGAPMRRARGADAPAGEPTVLILPPALAGPLATERARPLAAWLGERHAAGVILAGICMGTFLLAETGLLRGRAATTHWAYEERFRERFPDVRLDIDRLLIDDGDLLTAGGVMAWIDLGLLLTERFLGPEVMARTARLLLVDPPGREQRYYSLFSPRLKHGDAAILKVQHWLQATLAEDTRLACLAARAGLEERTFLRRFQKATGLTTTQYCQRLRIGRARELLQSGGRSIERVAWEVGYTDPGAFRKVFSRIVGLSPGEYRRRFAG